MQVVIKARSASGSNKGNSLAFVQVDQKVSKEKIPNMVRQRASLVIESLYE